MDVKRTIAEHPHGEITIRNGHIVAIFTSSSDGSGTAYAQGGTVVNGTSGALVYDEQALEKRLKYARLVEGIDTRAWENALNELKQANLRSSRLKNYMQRLFGPLPPRYP